MAGEHVNRILCAADPNGSGEAIDRLLAAGDQHGVDAIAVIGDIGENDGGERKVFRALARASCPVFWVPGAGDAPVERYLQEAFNIETAYPLLRGVHGTGRPHPAALHLPASAARSAMIRDILATSAGSSPTHAGRLSTGSRW